MLKGLLSRVLLVAFPLSLFCGKVSAQADIHFSQFYESSILRNPALTGVFAEDYKLSALYRDQWSSISNPFQTALVSAESRVSVTSEATDFFSYGLLAYYDKAGSIDRQITSFYPAVNYNKSMEDEHNSFLSVGFTGGYMQYSFNPSKATFNNQYVNGSFNSSNPTGEHLPTPHLGLWDLGAGINFNSSAGQANDVTYVIGASGYHFTQPKNSYYKDPSIVMDMRWNLNAALSAPLNEDFAFQLQANYAIQGSFNELIGSGLVGYNRIVETGEPPIFSFYVGALYRVNDAVIPTVKLRYMGYAFGVSYDVNVSTLKAATSMRGGYEISVVKTGMFPNKQTAVSKVLCPNFY